MTEYVQHFSTRIPWKDNGFSGKIDNAPKFNVTAQAIPNIAANRDLEFEEENKSKSYIEVETDKMQHWITENAAFMSENKIKLKMNHPYKKGNEKFEHYIETDFYLNPYSFLLRPFSWTLKEMAVEKSKYYNLYFDLEKTESMLTWNSAWVSHGESQKSIFNYFFSGIVPNTSLIFPYYKQVPFIEANRRVIAGIGNIINKVNIHEYATDGSRDEKNYIWETNASHSIREHGQQGFLMPYLEIIEYVKNNPEFDISTVTIFEPTGYRNDFSYTAEWVSYDAVIDILNQAKLVLNNIRKLNLKNANGEWVETQLKYVNKQLENVWNQRGIYPGLGAILSAIGIKYGFDIAKHIQIDGDDLINELSLYFEGEKYIGNDSLDDILGEMEDEFKGLIRNENKKKYFELLCRINLSVDQASNIWNKYKDNSIPIIENPYLLYEYTRMEPADLNIAISQIDNAMFINKLVIHNHPLVKPTKMRNEGDKRRFRAMVIFVLDQALNKGHTLLHFKDIIENINKIPLDQRTNFSTEKIEGIIDFLQSANLYVDEENKYIKLEDYQDYKTIINNVIGSRLTQQLPLNQDWLSVIDKQFGSLELGNEEKDKKARQEKAKALETISSSKISVLIGRAGTGKTSALGIFAASPEIASGGVLALTPTGKARVQLENSLKKNGVQAQFMTVAQFLIKSKGFSWNTMKYKIPTEKSSSIAKTVIIDESSMLTEEMFAGILKLVDAHAERIIFVGDPNQLPPIGAGRPFVDLIQYLEEKFTNLVAKLETEMRQGSGGEDLNFAQLFSHSENVDRNVLYRVQQNNPGSRLEFVEFKDLEHMNHLLFEKLTQILNMQSEDDIDGFNKSLGADVDGYTNYRTSSKIEDWQILTPTKFVGAGSFYLNEQIHNKYRQHIVEDWKKFVWRKSKPQSTQNIVFGDKVISNVNGNRKYYDYQEGEEYIANGEIGIMCSYPEHYGKNDKNKNWYKFRFKSFQEKVFSYSKADFGGENSDSKLELAYALTVHKSQGSGFGTTIAVLNSNSTFISKELLYTAFSRQKEKLVILSDIPAEELVRFSNDWYSDTKQRVTDLFNVPNIIEIEQKKQKRYFEERLIHKTTRGEMVRSKSELMVAEILNRLGVEYNYEEPLEVNGIKYIPDFTIRNKGRVAYLEHLGMLGVSSYLEKWEEKQKNYEIAGITEANGKLLITKDGLNGSFDAGEVEKIITNWINMEQ